MLRGIFFIVVCLAMIIVGVWIFEAIVWWLGMVLMALAGIGFIYGLYVLFVDDADTE